jgi:hypothetical protein
MRIQTPACRLYIKHAVYLFERRSGLLVAAIRDARRRVGHETSKDPPLSFHPYGSTWKA